MFVLDAMNNVTKACAQHLHSSTYYDGPFSTLSDLIILLQSLTQWRREGGHPPRAALCIGRHLEGQKYRILKLGRFWQIGVCIAGWIQWVH